MKKTLAIFLTFALILSMFTPALANTATVNDPESGLNKHPELTADALKNISAGAAISLGTPITEVQIMGNYVDVKDNGDVIFYGVLSGPPAILFAYDINTNEILDTKELKDDSGAGKVAYAVEMDSEGVINIATQSHCMFFRYDTKTKELKSYGKVFSETAVMSTGYVDSMGNYYFGTYPNSKLIKYDKAQDKLVDLGTMIPSGKYIRALSGYNDVIYMGGIGNPTTEWVKYDIKSGTKTTLKNPSLEGKFEEKDVENFYATSTAGKYLFARCKISALGHYYLCVFDMEKEEWVDFIPKTLHLHFTPFEGDVVYYHNNLGDGAKVYTYNPETKESKAIEGFDKTALNNYIIAPKFATLKNQEKYPGRTLIAGSSTNGIMLLNLEKKSIEFLKSTLPANATIIRTLRAGINGELILSAYMGSKFVVYDTNRDTIKYEGAHAQIEDIAVFRNKYYFGNYGREGAVSIFDPETRKAPTQLSKMTGADPEQDRVFNIVDGGNKVIWGSYPNYGKLGGAVAIYDENTKETKLFNQPVKNQCIAGLAYKKGKIYGSTSVYGGLGIDPIDAPAQLFIMDAVTGNVEKAVEVKLKTDKNTQYFVGDMLFDNDGNLWIACKKTLLKVNPDTLEIIKEISIGEGVQPLGTTRALPYCMEFGPDGLLYTNIGGKISAVDVKTDEFKILLDYNTNAFTIADNGDIYAISGSNSNYLEKIPVTRAASKESSVLADGISLFIGSPNAIVKGNKTLIDTANDKVIADTVEGRTLVPVRFIAENYGSEVGWDDATKTVTLKMADKTAIIVLDKKEITVGDKVIAIDVPAQTIEGRTMLPLRAFVEQVMGKSIFWDDRGLIVITDEQMLDASKDADAITNIIGKIK